MNSLALYLAQEGLSQSEPGVALVPLAIALFMTVLMAASSWKLYAKAGEPGWACLVPIYNIIVMLRITALPLWFFLLLLLPVLNLIAGVTISYRLAKAFGQGFLGFLGLVLLPFIAVPMLAFGGARYQRPA